MAPHLRRLAATLFFLSFPLAAFTQASTKEPAKEPTPAERVDAARSTYYNAATAGLQTFSCNVTFDWKGFFKAANDGKDVDDDNPVLVYFRNTHMSISDSIRSSGKLSWATRGEPPAELTESVSQIQGGLDAMMAGFFQSWNAFNNGSEIPAVDPNITVERLSEGFYLHGTDEGVTLTQKYDKNLLMTEATVVNKEMDTTLYPTFRSTPNGRLITRMRSMTRTPGMPEAVESVIDVEHVEVSGFSLPSAVTISIKNTPPFHFTFTDCFVKSEKPTATSTTK